MTTQGYTSELQRATGRSDLPELERLVDVYFGYCKDSSDAYFDQHSETMRAWMDLPRHDPDRALAAIMVAASRYDDPPFQCQVAVGVLEDLLRRPSDEILERIVVEARKTDRLRWMLSAIFRHAISPKALKTIEPLIVGRNADDPLPPRPHI